ncbi:MAG: S9 family peptidase [Alteromonadaceae bacterium]|uniref:prolyl oligopeptidase family serine peptidase n=1 Tax=Paraglaciecola chathamensis TaxID=368405 RepID=UPI000C45B0A0|nr:prolyl oligopeptidase family serine peptidase [Paraglaciecola agarilytica]MBN27378.1 S9 family peptidase [Alteromonadaceae bacterium]|tara:strand:- start:4489 stop:6663 length:2175 start_codon:yes stop_codon:yes gene_type:complete
MKLTLIAVGISALLMGCSTANQSNQQSAPSGGTSITGNQLQKMNLSYPNTRKDDVTDSYFGTQVADPYRWLEDDMSSETKQWVKAENAVTQAYLAQVPSRDKLKERLKVLLDYEKVGAPFKEGKYTYFFKNDGLQNQAVLYRQLDDGEAHVFLDPNTFSEDGTTSLASIEFSKDGSLVTYLISEGGSDWRKAITIDVETMQNVSETLTDLKFSDISWLGNEGFYYSSYDKPEGSELSAKTDQHKLYFHSLKDKQSEDTLVFGGTQAQKNRYVSGHVTEDNRYLLISAAVSTSGNKLYLKDLNEPDSELVTILDNTDSDTQLLDNDGSTLLLVTNLAAPNKRVVSVDASQPQPENWQDFIPETNNVLDVSTGGGYIFASYMLDAISNVKQLDKSGKLVREITLPGVGTASGFSGKKDQQTLYYSFTNYKTPSTIFSLDVESGESAIYLKSKAKFDSDAYESKQVFYTSKDGTKVPMIITHKKGLKLDGSNPTMLYGYGGFNISLQPAFSSFTAAWLEQGGVYAVPNLRGGGEYGKAWHDAGTKLQKQNVFDDFIAAAEFLIAQNYTSPDYLAIRGGSNGGLLVGATMLQRPELFKVALPAVGVLDMLRYHTFTAGAGWAYDYGTAQDSKEMFDYLMTYSPVQNVREGVNYPATLITTGDHDDRVVPAHSFKFAAELQAKHTGPNPMLIRIETNAGHGAGTPISKTIEQYADIFGFTLYNMGVKVQ